VTHTANGGPALRLLVAVIVLLWAFCSPASVRAAAWPEPADGTYVVPEFQFADGETMRDLRLHYVTLGTPHRDASGHVDNAVLILHGTGGDTTQFLSERFADVLFVPYGVLDASRFFIIIPDGIGHGKSSKPSDGMHARFPHYGYRDMVRAQHDLIVDALHVDRLRLVMGTSMGGMQTWLWGETYPTMMDALMPLASLPVQIGGRNRVWRDMIVDDLRNDPGYAGGEYKTQPAGLKAAVDVLWIFGSAPLYDQTLFPTRDQADAYYENTVKKLVPRYDANDMIYQFESSRDYDPQADLGKIVAPLLAVNSADDQINPPELKIVDRDIQKVRHGRYMLLPISPETRGHGTHTLAAEWDRLLRELLDTKIDVALPRTRDGRTVVYGDGTVTLPAGWLADTHPAWIHEFVYRLRPPSGPGDLEIMLSGAFYESPPTWANGKPICINGARGQVDDEGSYLDRSIVLWFPYDLPEWTHYVYMSYRKDDATAERVAHSLRVKGLKKQC
jgi:homoserine O-acetyltransferase